MRFLERQRLSRGRGGSIVVVVGRGAVAQPADGLAKAVRLELDEVAQRRLVGPDARLLAALIFVRPVLARPYGVSP